jgi:hypothetical protein
VNGSDFSELAANFGKGASGADTAALESFAIANGLEADVPEPAGLGFLGMSGVLFLSRRRKV